MIAVHNRSCKSKFLGKTISVIKLVELTIETVKSGCDECSCENKNSMVRKELLFIKDDRLLYKIENNKEVVGDARLLRTSCTSPFGSHYVRSKSFPTILSNCFASSCDLINFNAAFVFEEIKEVVGDARFELATPWTQTKCATKLR